MEIVTDMMVEAIDLMIELCSDEKQREGMTSMREMLCDFAESVYGALEYHEQVEAIAQYLKCAPHFSFEVEFTYPNAILNPERCIFRAADAQHAVDLVRQRFGAVRVYTVKQIVSGWS